MAFGVQTRNVPEERVESDGGGPVHTGSGSEEDAVHVGSVADVVARDGDQLVLGVADVDVSGEPVDRQTADVPRPQELNLWYHRTRKSFASRQRPQSSA